MSPSRLLVVIVVSGVVILAAVGCDGTAPAQTRPPGPQAARVEVVRPERAPVRRTVEQPGQIEAVELTPLHARVAGYVESWSVDIGARIKKGQVLAVLSVPELDAEAASKQAAVEEAAARVALAKSAVAVAEADLASTRAKLDEVRSGIKRAEAEVTRWRAEAHRVEQLYSEHALTGSLLDETRSKLQVAEAAREELTAQVQTAEAGVRQGQALLERSRAQTVAAEAAQKVATLDVRRVEAMRAFARIVAPYDGTVVRRNVEVGQLTEPGPRGEPLFVVDHSDRVRVVVGVPEMAAAAVDVGDRVIVRIQALPGRTIEGKVSRTAGLLDPQNRTLRVEADLPNSDGLLRPGLYANVTVVVDEHPAALTVPTTAIIRDGTRTACVVVSGGRASRVPVTVGLDDGTRAEILAGLKGDETVVKTGGAALAEGQAVEPGAAAKK
jgi:HlyD family secretion protein